MRDSALEEVDRRAMPVNEMNREFLIENEERLMGTEGGADSQYGKIQKPSAMLDRLPHLPIYAGDLTPQTSAPLRLFCLQTVEANPLL